MKTTFNALVHRLRQARAMALRAELAVTGAQILFWMALIGVVAGLALRLWTRHRQADPEPEAPALAD
ncbi:hypothetical protein [Mycobacterium sp.]|uniref:hypothetical protein n=1 Tax=Mycobacterium sp. TaxID=1785 RepID=UPI002C23F5B2|nr:hypothetical protein [Mycobacterium sp.]HTY33812.1 hypothetical protein [Mycobacterium sp.]